MCCNSRHKKAALKAAFLFARKNYFFLAGRPRFFAFPAFLAFLAFAGLPTLRLAVFFLVDFAFFFAAGFLAVFVFFAGISKSP